MIDPNLPPFMQTHTLGHVYEDTELTVFFGNRLSTRDQVARSFPDFKLLVLNQTHSSIVVRAPYSELTPEGDAHYTRERKHALCVRTADCMPVLIHDDKTGLIASIHAGWRGIESEIILKTGRQLLKEGAHFESARVWIGPHIGLESFEVGLDVAAKLEARFQAVFGHSDESTSIQAHIDPNKARVNLLTIARAQLHSLGFERERMSILKIDTFKSEAHDSHRRDRERAGRQISLIALK